MNINLDAGNTDKEYRDTTLKAYVCAVLDCPVEKFESITRDIKNAKDKKLFIEMILQDAESRLERIIK